MRTPESDVYQGLPTDHPGVAKFSSGADVQMPNSQLTICVSELRGAEATKDDPTLHRIFLTSIGTPVWEYTSEVQLVRGIRAAVLGEVSTVTSRLLY